MTEDPWPKKGDRLFVEPKGHYCACVGRLRFSQDDWYAYVEGYKRAAEGLVDNLSPSAGRSIDLLVYPIIFLFRHHLELRLKSLILRGDELYDRYNEVRKSHDLDLLWRMCRERLEQVWPDGDKEQLDNIGDCMVELTALDAKSDAFRYPITTDEAPSLPSNLTTIDLEHFVEVMAGIVSFLECADLGIDERLDWKQEAMQYQYWSGP